jgi:hypothetical protein
MMSCSSRAVHLIARVAIRVAPPVRAMALVATAARFAPRLRHDTAIRALDTLDGRGTCLSRALAVATRLDGAQVAIGVHYARSTSLRAHAWVVFNGAPLRRGDPDGDVIALIGPMIASKENGRRPTYVSDWLDDGRGRDTLLRRLRGCLT